jgi:L-arabinose isomerase
VSDKAFPEHELWFVAGCHAQYGDAAITQVGTDAREIAGALDAAPSLPVHVVAKAVVTAPEVFHRLCVEANADEKCIGVVAWMHTFSPAKMWIAGLTALQRPLLHLHTQFNAALPWAEIDMDYMNLHQSAHGDREFAHILTRMRLPRATAVGHWRDPETVARIGRWSRAARGWREANGLAVARFGDNMREVAVTEGDKVAAQLRFGISVNTYGVGDLVDAIGNVTDDRLEPLLGDYATRYELAAELKPAGARHSSLLDAARQEVALRELLTEGGFGAFTDTFEDLHGLTQLPGLAVQRLMADDFGFAGEGDWKTAALVRICKVMARGLDGGTSFMEDYTYDFADSGTLVLGAHMLEVCPTIANARPRCEIHPLSIGGHEDPVRLVFDAAPGPATVVSLIDIGDRFRLVANRIDVVEHPQPLPKLPVARAVWKPKPDFETATEAWMLAGGAHHTVFTTALSSETLEDFAAIAGVELLLIDGATTLRDCRNELRWNDVAFRLAAHT